MNEKLEEVLNSPVFVPAVIGVIGFGSGLGLGFFLGKRKGFDVEVHQFPVAEGFGFDLDVEVDDVEVTIAPAKETEPEEVTIPPRVVIDEDVAVRQGILKVTGLDQLRPSMLESDKVIEVEEVIEEEVTVEEELVTVTPDEEHAIPWDWDEELAKRTSTAPYILQQDEFFENEKNWTQTSLTYFAVDEKLVDIDNVPVYNHSSVVGELNFGHGSSDPNVVYIRNEELRAEYEITRLNESYETEIMGIEMERETAATELRHSRSLRFRPE